MSLAASTSQVSPHTCGALPSTPAAHSGTSRDAGEQVSPMPPRQWTAANPRREQSSLGCGAKPVPAARIADQSRRVSEAHVTVDAC